MFKNSKEAMQVFELKDNRLIVLKSNQAMRREEVEKDEKYYSEKLGKKVIIIPGQYDIAILPL